VLKKKEKKKEKEECDVRIFEMRLRIPLHQTKKKNFIPSLSYFLLPLLSLSY